MSYIGRDIAYGVFEKQLIDYQPGQHIYTLDWQAGSSTSLLVVSGGHILEPEQDYNITIDGQSINFVIVPTSRTSIVYLGRELEVPHHVGIYPVLNQFVALAGQTDFQVNISLTETIAIYKDGIIVFVEGIQQIFDHDFTVAGNIVSFNTAPGVGKKVDIYVHGVERFDRYGDLEWKEYIPEISSFGGMTIISSLIYQAEYLVMPVKIPNGLINKKYQTIKLKLDFKVNLGGTAHNIVRYSLPDIGDTVDECVPASININFYNFNLLESGIQTWGGTRYFDIQRQHGIDYVLGDYVRFKVKTEYDILVS